MTDYSLTVTNRSGRPQSFVLFQTIADTTESSVQLLALAWLVDTLPTGWGQLVFQWQVDYSVCCGYLSLTGAPGVFLPVSLAPVQLDGANSEQIGYTGLFPDGTLYFAGPPTVGMPGVIQFTADSTIPTPDQQQEQGVSLEGGIAMSGKPAVVIQLQPNLQYTLMPQPRYYIVAAALVEGQVIDAETALDAFEVIYDGVTDRTVVFDDDLRFRNG